MWKLNYKGSLVATLMVLATAVTPAAALDWHDPEWTGLGCPKTLSGDWIPETDSAYASLKIEFKSDRAILSSKESSLITHTFIQNAKEGHYLNLIRVSENQSSFPGYLKVRPHIAVENISEGRKLTQCKIKVFLFESKQKTKQMSYLSWDIYKREQ